MQIAPPFIGIGGHGFGELKAVKNGYGSYLEVTWKMGLEALESSRPEAHIGSPKPLPGASLELAYFSWSKHFQ